MRLGLAAIALAIAAPVPGLAQTTYVDLCRATQACDMAGTCQPSDFSFRFILEEDADGTTRDIVDMAGSPPMLAIAEETTQGFTFSNEKRVYTMLYLLNDAFPEDDDPEFVLLDADANGRVGAVTLYRGLCEVLE
jgi:hypothetical protein